MVALVLGIVTGVFWPDFAAQLKPLGDGFIKLIKMVVAPLVFGVVVHGIASAGDLKKVGRVGVKSIVYFELVTTVALILGVLVAWTFGPGHGMNVNTASLDGSALATYNERAQQIHGAVDFIVGIIPATFVGAFANGDVLQVLVLAVLFGSALSLVGERGKPVADLIEILTELLFRIIGFIIRLAPLGVFGAIAYTVGKYGVGSLQQLGTLVFLYYATVVFFVLVVLGGILRLAGFSIIKLLRYFREELMIVLGTASSDSVLPQIMRKLEHMGIKDSTVGLVIPTGYSFNLDAFSIYLTLATVFIAQATNTPLATSDLLLILGVALLTSKGAHGIPGSAIVVLAATLSAVPVIPAIGLVLVLSVDWFMGMARALGNLIGNCVATVVIAAWEGDIDRDRAHAVLNGTLDEPTEDLLLEPTQA